MAGLFLVAAARRRQGGQETGEEQKHRPAQAGRTIRNGGQDDTAHY
jgi:hypothetical protein